MENLSIWTLIISIIGAAAWIPHLVSLVISLIKKPTITIIPLSVAEVGFTELGPIINMKIAIASDNGDSLIDLIELNVVHDSGSIYKFQWHEIMEIKGQLSVAGAPSQSALQFLESEATAIKILKSDLKNLLLKNRLYEHTISNQRYLNNFHKERRRLLNNAQYMPDAFYATKASQDLQDFLKSQMLWKKGKYKIEIHLNTQNTTNIICPTLSFELTEDDIVLMQANSDNIPKLIRSLCYEGLPLNNNISIEWHWLYKNLEKE